MPGCSSTAETRTKLRRSSASLRCGGEAGIAYCLQKHGLYFFLMTAGTVTHHLGLGKEDNGCYHRALQPKPFADPTLPSPMERERKTTAVSAPLRFSLRSSEAKPGSHRFGSGSSRQKQLAEDSAISLLWNLKVYF